MPVPPVDPLWAARQAIMKRPEEFDLPEPPDNFIEDIAKRIKGIVVESPDKYTLYLDELKPEGRLGRTLDETERKYITEYLRTNARSIYGAIE